MNRRRTILGILVGTIFLFVIVTFYTTFSLTDDYYFNSVVYSISDGKIEGISPYTDISLYLDYFDLDNCFIKVVDKNNEEVVTGYVMNGSKTLVEDINHKVVASYENIIIGDSDQNGTVDEEDFSNVGKALISNSESLDKDSLDVTSDGEVRLNDLILLDKTVHMDYQELTLDSDSMVLQTGELGRVGYYVEPGYGKNTNLKWSSSNVDVVTVRNSGAMVGGTEGEAVVKAETQDGKLFKEVKIKVDNTIQLSSYEGVGYIGGSDVVVDIKAIDYDGITCISSDEVVASCRIEEEKLVMTAKGQGNVIVTVKSTKYGEVSYVLDAYSVYLNVMPKYLCITPNNVKFITVSGFFTGDLSFKMSDQDIIKDAYMSIVNQRNMLRIELGAKQGRGTLTVKESNGNVSNDVVIDVTRISIPEIGSLAKVGEEVSTTIVGDHVGILSCTSRDINKAACRIEGNQLIVTPLALGNVTIDVLNQFIYNGQTYDCGESQFLVVIQE